MCVRVCVCVCTRMCVRVCVCVCVCVWCACACVLGICNVIITSFLRASKAAGSCQKARPSMYKTTYVEQPVSHHAADPVPSSLNLSKTFRSLCGTQPSNASSTFAFAVCPLATALGCSGTSMHGRSFSLVECQFNYKTQAFVYICFSRNAFRWAGFLLQRIKIK